MMKINGKKIEGPNREYVVIPRGQGDDIVFTVEAILDMRKFEKVCPLPKPPMRKIDGVDIPQISDKSYLQRVNHHSEERLAWMIITSLVATEGLEWDTVDPDDRRTWSRFRKEMQDSGFSDMEINRIVAAVVGVNALDEAKIQEARDRFLRLRQARQNVLSSRKVELPITRSGEPVKDLE